MRTRGVSIQSEKLFVAAKSSATAKTTKTPISGLGDEAIFIGVQNFSSLSVRKETCGALYGHRLVNG